MVNNSRLLFCDVILLHLLRYCERTFNDPFCEPLPYVLVRTTMAQARNRAGSQLATCLIFANLHLPTMPRIDDPSNAEPILLTLPPSDLLTEGGGGSTGAGGGGAQTSTSSANNGDDDSADQLLLLQLPAKSALTVEDLASGRAYIVGPGPGDEDADDMAASANGGAAGTATQACLVVEGSTDAGSSYALCKVETSNALVMVPPQEAKALASASSGNGSGDGNDVDGESPPKKLKQSDGGPTVRLEMHAQLLEAGGSGASFLDLRPHPLNVAALRRMLQKTVCDPYSSSSGGGSAGTNGGGKTIAQLAAALRVPRSQVRQVLTDFGAGTTAAGGTSLASEAFELPPHNSGRWGVLSEEAREDACMGIVSVLAECEQYANTFAGGSRVGKSVAIADFVQEVVRRSAEAEGDGTACLDEVVVEHCLRCCSVPATITGSSVQLDLDKLALILAHHLFNQQTTPWRMTRFEAEWQRLMPCVGDSSKPNVDLLAGVALQRAKDELSPAVLRALADKSNSGDDNADKTDGSEEAGDDKKDVYLTYLPEHRLSAVPEKRFDVLFKEKEGWTLDDIEPYVKRLVEEAGSTIEEMLMKHTLSTEEDGKKIYTKR